MSQITITFEDVDGFRSAFENHYNDGLSEQLYHCQKELAEANERILVLEGRLENKNSERVFTLQRLESAMKENEVLFADSKFIPTIKFVRSLTDMSIQEGKDFVKNTLPCFSLEQLQTVD